MLPAAAGDGRGGGLRASGRTRRRANSPERGAASRDPGQPVRLESGEPANGRSRTCWSTMPAWRRFHLIGSSDSPRPIGESHLARRSGKIPSDAVTGFPKSHAARAFDSH